MARGKPRTQGGYRGGPRARRVPSEPQLPTAPLPEQPPPLHCSDALTPPLDLFPEHLMPMAIFPDLAISVCKHFWPPLEGGWITVFSQNNTRSNFQRKPQAKKKKKKKQKELNTQRNKHLLNRELL